MLSEGFKTFKFIRHFKKLKNAKDDIAKQRALLYLKELLKTEGGVLTKFLQYQGTSANEVKEIQELTQQKLEGISLEDINQILKSNLGEKYKDLKDVSTDAIAASVGQVHFAKLNGEDIAIKIQYPDIKRTFIDQLKLLNVLPAAMSVTPMRKWGIDLKSYQVELTRLIEQECNYNHEANQLDDWEKYLKDQKHCFVPKTYREYSNESILVQSYIDGVQVESVVEHWTEEEKRDIGEKLIRSYFNLFFNHKIIQGDTNHGNFLFNREKMNIYFIDLGQTVSFEDNFVNAFIYILERIYNEKEYSSLSFFVALGFDEKKIEHITDKLDLLIEILFQPLFADYAYNLNEWDYKKELDYLLGDDKWWFRSAGGTEFFLFMKSFMGLKNLICKLDIKVFFKGILNDELKAIGTRSIPILSQDPESKIKAHSTHIGILVKEGDFEKVKMTIPLVAIFDIREYFDEKTQKKIKEQNINLDEIIKNALNDGGKPKEIFHLDIDKKTISVSLVKK